MSYSICQRKYLLWAVFDDNDDDDDEFINFKIREFRVCDCFLEWTIRFQNVSKDVVFSEEIITDFFDAILVKRLIMMYFLYLAKLLFFAVKMHCIIFSIRKILIMINLLMNV